MNEWQTISWMMGIGGVVFAAFWILLVDFRRGNHLNLKACERAMEERVRRCEHAIDTLAQEHGNTQNNFITVKAFDRFEHNLNSRFDGISDSVKHLTTRIDDFIVSNRNGKAKEKDA